MGVQNQHYKMQSVDELMEYAWLKPKDSGLKLDIFVDDGFAYAREEHPLLLFVRNGFGRSCSSFFPISISEKPKILDSDIIINVDNSYILEIYNFIQANVMHLRDLANEKISINEFFEKLRINGTD